MKTPQNSKPKQTLKLATQAVAAMPGIALARVSSSSSREIPGGGWCIKVWDFQKVVSGVFARCPGPILPPGTQKTHHRHQFYEECKITQELSRISVWVNKTPNTAPQQATNGRSRHQSSKGRALPCQIQCLTNRAKQNGRFFVKELNYSTYITNPPTPKVLGHKCNQWTTPSSIRLVSYIALLSGRAFLPWMLFFHVCCGGMKIGSCWN